MNCFKKKNNISDNCQCHTKSRCEFSQCDNVNKTDSLFCLVHSCAYKNCPWIIKDLKRYCIIHCCQNSDCMGWVKDGERLCYSCLNEFKKPKECKCLCKCLCHNSLSMEIKEM